MRPAASGRAFWRARPGAHVCGRARSSVRLWALLPPLGAPVRGTCARGGRGGSGGRDGAGADDRRRGRERPARGDAAEGRRDRGHAALSAAARRSETGCDSASATAVDRHAAALKWPPPAAPAPDARVAVGHGPPQGHAAASAVVRDLCAGAAAPLARLRAARSGRAARAVERGAGRGRRALVPHAARRAAPSRRRRRSTSP